MAEAFRVERDGVTFTGESDGPRTKPRFGFTPPGAHAHTWSIRLVVSPSSKPPEQLPRTGYTIRSGNERGDVIGPEKGWTLDSEEALDGGFWIVRFTA